MSASRQCYWPNNKVANGNYPCSDSEITACCGSNSICLSNGYCMDISQPFTLSRGGCTSDTWASGCPTACQQSEFNYQGSAIINLSYDSSNDSSTYCCGTAIGTGSGQNTTCQFGYDSFLLNDAHVLAGYAALADYTNTTSTSGSSSNDSTCSNSSSSAPTTGSHDVALGAGLGVPLGVIALGSLLWAFWERRRANRLSKALADNIPVQNVVYTPQTPQSRLVTGQSRLTELEGVSRPQELPGNK